jgi:hypothetical protein
LGVTRIVCLPLLSSAIPPSCLTRSAKAGSSLGVKDSKEQQTLVVLLHPMAPDRTHDKVPNLGQGLGGVLGQDLF